MKYASLAGVLLILLGSATAVHDEIDTTGEPVLGEEDAEVTIVAFEDFQCPFCKRFEDNSFPKIKENYVDTGQAKIVWKDRPLPRIHPWAEDAAAVMECIYREENDVFWEVKSTIYDNQDSISEENVESTIKEWAAEEGVSESEVDECLENGSPMDEVNTDSQEGQDLGASGTPTVFVGSQKIVGAQPYSNFESAIESELQGDEDESSEESSTEPEDLEERLNESQDSREEEVNVTALQQRVEEQQDKIENLEEDQDTILNILDTVMSLLGL